MAIGDRYGNEEHIEMVRRAARAYTERKVAERAKQKIQIIDKPETSMATKDKVSLDTVIELQKDDSTSIKEITSHRGQVFKEGDEVIILTSAKYLRTDNDGDLVFHDAQNTYYLNTSSLKTYSVYKVALPSMLKVREAVSWINPTVGVIAAKVEAIAGSRVCISFVSNGIPSIEIVSMEQLVRPDGQPKIIYPEGKKPLTVPPPVATGNLEI